MIDLVRTDIADLTDFAASPILSPTSRDIAAAELNGDLIAFMPNQFSAVVGIARLGRSGVIETNSIDILAIPEINRLETAAAVTVEGRLMLLLVDLDHAMHMMEIDGDLSATLLDSLDLSDNTTTNSSHLFEAHGALYAGFLEFADDRLHLARFDLQDGFVGPERAGGLEVDDIGAVAAQVFAAATVGPRAFVYIAASALGDQGIAVAELNRDGSLSVLSTIGETPSNGVVRRLENVEIDGRDFLIAGSFGAIEVFRIGHDGGLTRVQAPLPRQNSDFALSQEDGIHYLYTQGTLFELSSSGQLLELAVAPERRTPQGDAESPLAAGGVVDGEAMFFEVLHETNEFFEKDHFGLAFDLRFGPDLVIDAETPLTLSEGVRLSLGGNMTFERIGVVNEGDEAATDYGISVFVSLDEVFGTEAELRAGVPILRTEAGAAIGGVGGAVAHQIAVVGDAFLHVFVDPLGEVAETNEENNVATLRVQVTPFTEGDDDVTLERASDFDWLALGGNDSVSGTTQSDVIFGGGGRDSLSGGRRADELHGDGAGDRLFGQGGEDMLAGGRGRDFLFGGGGRDRLEGGGGRDVLTGDRGSDVMIGGAGRDVFVIGRRQGADVIEDFTGRDRIQIDGGAGSFARLRIRDAGDDAVVSGRGFKATLLDVEASSLDAGDFLFG